MGSWECRGAAVASRTDHAAGIREVVEFFGSQPERMAGTRHAPVGPASASVVLCPSICADLTRNYRREVLLARELAARGIITQRLHYRGTGNSDGDTEAITFEGLLADARDAVLHLHAHLPPAPTAFMGTRFGALVAASTARDFPGAPLVLFEPVLDAIRFFREGFRARLASEAKSRAQDASSSARLVAELREAGTIDVLGHTVGRQLYESSVNRSLLAQLDDQPRPVLLVQLGTTGPPPVARQQLADVLEARGCDVTLVQVGRPWAWWFLDEPEDPSEDLVAVVADWLQTRLVSEETVG